ncbi:MAG: ROK family protein [Candidatus Nanopelagicales bacterium]
MVHDSPTWPDDVTTLAVDVGGSGIKGSVLDAAGALLVDRVRMDTPYPCPPELLVASIVELAADLPRAHRASIGFPGLVRDGRVIEVPSLSRLTYDGEPDPAMAGRWHGFDLGHELADVLGIPTLVVNDADMQACAVVEGSGMEFVLTLGTGVGTALFYDGHLVPHLELSHGPFRDGLSFDIALGNVERKRIGKKRWLARVREAIADFDEMIVFDRIYVGGGNAKHLEAGDAGPKGRLVSNSAGVIGGVRLWDVMSASGYHRA